MKIEFEITRTHLAAAVLSAALVLALNASASGDNPQMSAAAPPTLPMGQATALASTGQVSTPVVAAPVGLTPASAPQLPSQSSPQPASIPVLPTASAPAPAPVAVAAPAVAAPAVATAPTAKPRVKRHIAQQPTAVASLDVPPLSPLVRDELRRSEAWASNEQATVDGAGDGRVIFTFGETMPTIVCAPLRVCDVELQPGEKVLGTPNVGDNVRWDISPGHSGSGADAQTHVILKPHEAGLDTNLVISTDRRTYHLRLVSDPSNYVSDVAFSYPSDDKKAWDAEIAATDAKKTDVVATLPPLSADKLDFNFTVKRSSGSPSWMPVRVFDDGSHTYIQMPAGMDSGEAPVLVLLDDSGKEQLVNYRLRGDYYVIDRVIDRAALEAGVGHSSDRVDIRHVDCSKRGFFGGCKD